MNTPYLQYKDYMKERYGDPLYRVPIDFDLGCPHRESYQNLNQELLDQPISAEIQERVRSLSQLTSVPPGSCSKGTRRPRTGEELIIDPVAEAKPHSKVGYLS